MAYQQQRKLTMTIFGYCQEYLGIIRNRKDKKDVYKYIDNQVNHCISKYKYHTRSKSNSNSSSSPVIRNNGNKKIK